MPRKRHVAFPLKRFIPLILLIPLIIFVLFLVLRVFVSGGSIILFSSPVFPKGVKFVNNQIIVKYKQGQSPNELRKVGKTEEVRKLTAKLTMIGVLSQEKLFTTDNSLLSNYYLFVLKQNLNIPKVYEQLSGVSEIENVTPNYILTTQATPNDPYFKDGQQWDMKKINMEKAWRLQKGKSSVIVAVIDTGADYNQEDLKGAIIKGENEMVTGGDVMDDNGHGTHVSGTIAAVTNNGIGISSVSWGVKVLAIKACDMDGDCPTSGVLAGIQYAVDQGARIINISIAGNGSCAGDNAIGNIFNHGNAYDDAIKYATDRNVLIIAAAGNHNQNANNEVPGACRNVMAVGATTQDNTRWIGGNTGIGSNYGTKVQIAAPGAGIFSTSNKGGYVIKNGTSMSAPHVSGVIALLLSLNKNLSRQKLIDCLVNTATPLSTDLSIGPLLNPAGALVACGARHSLVSDGARPTPTPTVFAQQPFSISGIVFLDKNGDGLLQDQDLKYPGAQVLLSGFKSDSAVSNNAGRYIFPSLIPGLYTISLTVNGRSIGEPIDVTLSSQSSIVKLDLPISMGTVPLPVTPTPTPKSQQTSSVKCVPDPACAKSGKSIQLCSFKCTPN